MLLHRVYEERERPLFGRRPDYILNVVAIQVAAWELYMLRRHKLLGDLLYQSDAALQREAEAASALELADEAIRQHADRHKALRLRLRAFRIALFQVPTETSCSVAEVLAGKSFVARDVSSLITTFQGISAGFSNLTAKLQVLWDFDQGTEHTVAPKPPPDGDGSPADWAAARRT